MLTQVPPAPGEEEEQIRETLQRLERAQKQLEVQTRLVNDLLDVSRLQADRLELQLAECDLVQFVREAVEDQHLLAPTRQIDIRTEAEEVLVWADGQRVGQVISNYLTNALKYSEAKEPVEVAVRVAGPLAHVAVHDRGPGLSREQQQHIWERFYRVPGIAVKSGSGGSLGLGLHICRQLIERQGGQVGVESSEGTGSTFWFTLPCVPS